MKPKGRRVAIIVTALGLATPTVTAFLLRERIEEAWYVHNFGTGDDRHWLALQWMQDHGREASLEIIIKHIYASDNSHQRSKLGQMKADLDQINDDLERAWDLEAYEAIKSRIGDEGTNTVVLKLLTLKNTPKITATIAICAVRSYSHFMLSFGNLKSQTIDLAAQRLREYLSNPDPLVRAMAARGLGEAGELAGACLPAIEPLKNDADPRVREAATHALKRLQALAVPAEQKRE